MKCNRCGKENVDPVYPHTCTPLALKLANELEDYWVDDGLEAQAAAELRRLHTESEALREALQACINYGAMTGDEWVAEKARAALAQAGDAR